MPVNIYKDSNVVLLLCGSFNPPTVMHRRMLFLARHELQKLGCVCNHAIVSPVSNRYGKEGLLSNENRYEMLNLTFRNDEWVRVSDWELIQPDWVRTVDVFLHYSEEVKMEYNGSLIYVCGADILQSMVNPEIWSPKDVDWLLTNTTFILITRGSLNTDDVTDLINSFPIFIKNKDNIIIVTEWFYDQMSSTKVRNALRRDHCVTGVIDDYTLNYIQDNNLYRDLEKKHTSTPALEFVA